MVEAFSSIVISVPDLALAAEEYSWLLDSAEGQQDTAVQALSNVAIQLREDREIKAPRISGLELWDPEAGALPTDIRQLPLTVTPERAPNYAENESGVSAVDHIVLRTRDANDCIRLFGEDLGMRLALDQQVPEWGGRMLFFRHGKMTLEVIQNLEEPVDADHFWGITYLCPDLDATIAALDRLEVAHSPVRDGRKPGTRVATVKSHTLGIPTLLIEPARG